MEKPTNYLSIFQQAKQTNQTSIFSNIVKDSQKSRSKASKIIESESTQSKKLKPNEGQPSFQNKIEILDHAKPRKMTSTRAFQQLFSWLFTKQGINPLWINIENKNLMQNFVFITIPVPGDFEKNFLTENNMPYLSSFYKKNNIAVFKENIVQNEENYWHQIFQTKLVDEVSLPLFNKNISAVSQQVTTENLKLLSFNERLFLRYESFAHNIEILKSNLYPTSSSDFPDFVQTSTSSIIFQEVEFQNRILALDCEMVSTENGLELARLCLLNFEGDVLIDELVKTPNRILNYNTQYSGITELMLRDVTFNLEQAQNRLLQYVTKDTILIGHSLENDLIAMKVIHNKVIDTSILYLTKSERKLKLRDLTQKFLNCKIQVGSHCPCEDAKSTLCLAKLRIEILDKFDSSSITSAQPQIQLDLLDSIIKTNNTILILDETERLMKLLQYGIHFDELKKLSNEEKIDKILKTVKKKKELGCIIPRIILTKLNQLDLNSNFKELDDKLKEIVSNSPSNSAFAVNFELIADSSSNLNNHMSNPFCIFIGI